MGAQPTNQRIDIVRLWDTLMDLARDRRHPEGRGAAAGAHRNGPQRPRPVPRPVPKAGLAVRVDAIGNMFARREAATRTACRCCSAAISTASRPAENSTARSA